jgi:putative transposase
MVTKFRRKFSPEFRDTAVRDVTDQSRPVAEVARGLGLVEQTLRNWVAAHRDRHGDPTGVCDDNARAESFNGTLKVERVNRTMLAVADWIERVYNRRRRHSALNMLSSVQFEKLHRQLAEAA